MHNRTTHTYRTPVNNHNEGTCASCTPDRKDARDLLLEYTDDLTANSLLSNI